MYPIAATCSVENTIIWQPHCSVTFLVVWVNFMCGMSLCFSFCTFLCFHFFRFPLVYKTRWHLIASIIPVFFILVHQDCLGHWHSHKILGIIFNIPTKTSYNFNCDSVNPQISERKTEPTLVFTFLSCEHGISLQKFSSIYSHLYFNWQNHVYLWHDDMQHCFKLHVFCGMNKSS